MINIFLTDYPNRLRSWLELRETLKNSDIKNICVLVDNFWQQAPLRNHYLHISDINDWPDPWQLLHDNDYCLYARALGMIYTLLLLGITDVELVEAIDYNNENVVLVLVDSANYVLNYWPDSVLNTSHKDYTVTKHINIDNIKTKIGKL